ncbi:hypothetical protein LZ30DRAFT_713759 [Colletotrichum cereale]|nr:hypothetical protein LZ30DRAFT_713759 [Colletotrichum cereale]
MSAPIFEVIVLMTRHNQQPVQQSSGSAPTPPGGVPRYPPESTGVWTRVGARVRGPRAWFGALALQPWLAGAFDLVGLGLSFDDERRGKPALDLRRTVHFQPRVAATQQPELDQPCGSPQIKTQISRQTGPLLVADHQWPCSLPIYLHVYLHLCWALNKRPRVINPGFQPREESSSPDGGSGQKYASVKTHRAGLAQTHSSQWQSDETRPPAPPKSRICLIFSPTCKTAAQQSQQRRF